MKLDIGLLVTRIGFGGMMLLAHGWPKLLGFSEKMHTFSDPLGVGPAISLTLAVFAEVFCSVAVVLGVATRYALVPLVTTMGVAAFVVHASDPWGKKEMAVMYGLVFILLFLTGPGKYSLEAIFSGRRRG